MLALAAYKRDVHACGLHKSVIEDPENNVLVPDQDTCPVCAYVDRYERRVAAEDEKKVKAMGKDPDPDLPRPWDGRSLFLRPATPAELIERQTRLDRQRRRRGEG